MLHSTAVARSRNEHSEATTTTFDGVEWRESERTNVEDGKRWNVGEAKKKKARDNNSNLIDSRIHNSILLCSELSPCYIHTAIYIFFNWKIVFSTFHANEARRRSERSWEKRKERYAETLVWTRCNFQVCWCFSLFFSPLSLTLSLCVECMQHQHTPPAPDWPHIFVLVLKWWAISLSTDIIALFIAAQKKEEFNSFHSVSESRRQLLRAAHIMKTSLTRRSLDHGSLARSSEWNYIGECFFFGAGKWATVWNVHGGWQVWRWRRKVFISTRSWLKLFLQRAKRGEIQLEKFLASSSGCFFALSSFLCSKTESHWTVIIHSIGEWKWESFLSQGFNWCEEDWGILEKFSSISIELIKILKKFSFDLRLSSSNLKILKASTTKR